MLRGAEGSVKDKLKRFGLLDGVRRGALLPTKESAVSDYLHMTRD